MRCSSSPERRAPAPCPSTPSQAPLAASLCELQSELPPSLMARPSPVGCHSAGALYRAYTTALGLPLSAAQGANADAAAPAPGAGGAGGATAASALRHLQCAGNCLALLHMANSAVGAALPSRFAQAAPMLGITAVPTGGCAGAPGLGDGGPTPGLRAPPFEDGAPGHFHCMLLGPSARLVTESQLLVVQSCELQAWRATRGLDCMPRCMERVSAALQDLREVVDAAAALAEASAARAGDGSGTSTAAGAARGGPVAHHGAIAGAPAGAAAAAPASPTRGGALSRLAREAPQIGGPPSPFAAAAAQVQTPRLPVIDTSSGTDAEAVFEAAADEAQRQAEAAVAAVAAAGSPARRRAALAAAARAALRSPRDEASQQLLRGARPGAERGASPLGEPDELTPPVSGRDPVVTKEDREAVMWYINTQAVHSQRSSARTSLYDGHSVAASYGKRAAAESGGRGAGGNGDAAPAGAAPAPAPAAAAAAGVTAGSSAESAAAAAAPASAASTAQADVWQAASTAAAGVPQGAPPPAASKLAYKALAERHAAGGRGRGAGGPQGVSSCVCQGPVGRLVDVAALMSCLLRRL
jgi:hypothetical protein